MKPTRIFIVTNEMERSETTDYYYLCKDYMVPDIEIRHGDDGFSTITCDHPWLQLSSGTKEDINGNVETVENPLGIQLDQLFERCADGIAVSCLNGEAGSLPISRRIMRKESRRSCGTST